MGTRTGCRCFMSKTRVTAGKAQVYCKQKPPNLVQMRVSGDVVAALLGFDASFGVAPGMAHPHRLDRLLRWPVPGPLGAGQLPEPARCRRAPAQRQRGSSRERVHATCGHSMWGGNNTMKYRRWRKSPSVSASKDV